MKLIYIENVLILVNLILILYLVYVLSNRTIEKFYHEDLGLDPSVPGFEPHTHRDSTSTPENEGCGDLCEPERWERPSIPSIIGATTSITDNTLTISNITLDKSIDHQFYDLWYIEIGIFQGAWKTVESINDNLITSIATNNRNVYNLSAIFNRNGNSNTIILKLQSIGVTTNFKLYLGVLDENKTGKSESTYDRFTFNKTVEYTLSCSPNYYNNDGICELCPENQELVSGSCKPCPDGMKRPSDHVGGCVACDNFDYNYWSLCEDWVCGTTPTPTPTQSRSYNSGTQTCGTQTRNCTNCTNCNDDSLYQENLVDNCIVECTSPKTPIRYMANKKASAPTVCPATRELTCPEDYCYESIENKDVRIEVVNEGERVDTYPMCLSKNMAHSSGGQQNDIGLNPCGAACGQKFHAKKVANDKWRFVYKEQGGCTNDSHGGKVLDMDNGMGNHHWTGRLELQNDLNNVNTNSRRNFIIDNNNTAYLKQPHNAHSRKMRNSSMGNYYLRYDDNKLGSDKDKDGSTIYFRKY